MSGFGLECVSEVYWRRLAPDRFVRLYQVGPRDRDSRNRNPRRWLGSGKGEHGRQGFGNAKIIGALRRNAFDEIALGHLDRDFISEVDRRNGDSFASDAKGAHDLHGGLVPHHEQCVHVGVLGEKVESQFARGAELDKLHSFDDGVWTVLAEPFAEANLSFVRHEEIETERHDPDRAASRHIWRQNLGRDLTVSEAIRRYNRDVIPARAKASRGVVHQDQLDAGSRDLPVGIGGQQIIDRDADYRIRSRRSQGVEFLDLPVRSVLAVDDCCDAAFILLECLRDSGGLLRPPITFGGVENESNSKALRPSLCCRPSGHVEMPDGSGNLAVRSETDEELMLLEAAELGPPFRNHGLARWIDGAPISSVDSGFLVG